MIFFAIGGLVLVSGVAVLYDSFDKHSLLGEALEELGTKRTAASATSADKPSIHPKDHDADQGQ